MGPENVVSFLIVVDGPAAEAQASSERAAGSPSTTV